MTPTLPDTLPPETILWRYMSFPKFAHMIQSKCLVFVSPNRFEDKFEGSFTEGDIEQYVAALRKEPDKANVLLQNVASLSGYNRMMNEMAYLSCWHRGDDESDAMWKVYGRDAECVAIRTTAGTLASILPALGVIRPVQYMNESAEYDLSNIFNPYVRKRLAFEHEREVRAICLSWPLDRTVIEYDEHTLRLPIDPSILIQVVRVAPTSSEWFINTVKTFVATNGLDVPVGASTLVRPRIDLQREFIARLQPSRHADVTCPLCNGSGVALVPHVIYSDQAHTKRIDTEVPQFCERCDVVAKMVREHTGA